MLDFAVRDRDDDVSSTDDPKWRRRVLKPKRALSDVSRADGSAAPRREPTKVGFTMSIRALGRVFHMRNAFMFEVEGLSDGTVFVRHRELPVYGYGESFRVALQAFSEMFERQWAELVEADIKELTASAVAVRYQLMRAVDTVTAE